jgi:hypothetical protein
MITLFWIFIYLIGSFIAVSFPIQIMEIVFHIMKQSHNHIEAELPFFDDDDGILLKIIAIFFSFIGSWLTIIIIFFGTIFYIKLTKR